MKFSEAEIICKSCLYAFPVAMEPLPQVRPDPNQDATIYCKAPIRAGLKIGLIYYDERLNVIWNAAGDECVMLPDPNGETCERVKIVEARGTPS